MFFRLTSPLFESEERTFHCWLNTLLIATREKRINTLGISTRKRSNYLCLTPGLETYANCKTSLNALCCFAKRRFSRLMKAGCRNSRFQQNPKTKLSSHEVS